MINLQKYTTRKGTLADADKILGLINPIQPIDPWTLQHLKWQYFDEESSPTLIYIHFLEENRFSHTIATR